MKTAEELCERLAEIRKGYDYVRELRSSLHIDELGTYTEKLDNMSIALHSEELDIYRELRR